MLMFTVDYMRVLNSWNNFYNSQPKKKISTTNTSNHIFLNKNNNNKNAFNLKVTKRKLIPNQIQTSIRIKQNTPY